MGDATQWQQEIAQLFVKELRVEVPSMEMDLVETGILDSFTFLELLMHLENRFGMRVSMEDLEIDRFRSVVKIAAFVRDHGGIR
jgi:methoxymalonate biosynthesis acyl carrier protein